ncbi:M56 family metallopeptidase [Thalassotalea sp. G2M2-11]|uniref:M56 family metallopeptidase n=1 Tax=Thalassotalea sp. G2M2-11 TaxID=2787627 RepID=UPI002407795E|nr:M56 family metallopeptidase [Thalassotalea sp. G2M2-11]
MVATFISLLYPLSISLTVLLVSHSIMSRKIGAANQYLMWSIVPMSLIAYLLPLPVVQHSLAVSSQVSRYIVNPTQDITPLVSSDFFIYLWLSVSTLMLAYWLVVHIHFVRHLSLKKLTFAQLAQLPFDGEPPKQLATYYSEQAYSPMLVGLFKQKLVLPTNFHSLYNLEQQQLILQHEICHFDRNDIYWNLVAFILVALFWFHPLVWLAYFRFRRDQELSCDSRVLARKHMSSRVNYSKALLVAAQTAPRIAFAQLSFKKYGDKAIMFERIKQIKANHKASTLSVSLVSLMTVAMLSSFSYAGNLGQGDVKQQYRTPPKEQAISKPIMRVEPKYPLKAAEEKIEGSVVLKFDVNTDGNVMNVEVMKGKPAYVFDRVAIAALKKWKYEPVSSVVRNNLVQLDFRMDENSTYEDVDLIEKINVVEQ